MDGFAFGFDNNNTYMLVYKDNALYFKTSSCNGIYESVIGVSRKNNLILNVGSSNLDKSCLWHCRLGYINKKRITKLQSNEILKPFNLQFNGD